MPRMNTDWGLEPKLINPERRNWKVFAYSRLSSLNRKKIIEAADGELRSSVQNARQTEMRLVSLAPPSRRGTVSPGGSQMGIAGAARGHGELGRVPFASADLQFGQGSGHSCHSCHLIHI